MSFLTLCATVIGNSCARGANLRRYRRTRETRRDN
jgi:hypothetical protein